MAAAAMCSTPFGITELVTAEPIADLAGLLHVLNAFRHH